MVEEASGQRLDGYFGEHIGGPLGMDSTAFGLSDEMQSRQSAVHARLPDGSLTAIDLARSPEPDFPSGGGGLYSTVEDYCCFLQMILGRGSRRHPTPDSASASRVHRQPPSTRRSPMRG